LTPPFGFALFYLRGVADKAIRTLDIYKGASIFIVLQLIGLAIAGMYPVLVNYLPNRTHLLSDTAPPPINPKLQACLTDYVITEYAGNETAIRSAIKTAQGLDVSYLPDRLQTNFTESTAEAGQSFDLMAQTATAKAALDDYIGEYEPIHRKVRGIERQIKSLGKEIDTLEADIKSLSYSANDESALTATLQATIDSAKAEQDALAKTIPENWATAREKFVTLNTAMTKAQRNYYNITDGSYQTLSDLRGIVDATDALKDFRPEIDKLADTITLAEKDKAMSTIKAVESRLSDIAGSSKIKSALSKARRTLKKDDSETGRAKAMTYHVKAIKQYQSEMAWRARAQQELSPALTTYNTAIANTIGLRSQPRLSDSLAKQVALCQSSHRDISLNF
ncbi:MAG: hypothetical protein ACPG47_10985, partial [Leucothrix sp.]